MSNRLRDGAQRLTTRLKTSASSSVTYRRTLGNQVVASARIGKTPYEVTTADGIVLRSQMRDYIIDAADLVGLGYPNEPFEPRPGDLINEGTSDNPQLFEVMEEAGEKCWRWHDRYHTTYRIHAKFTGNTFDKWLS